MMNLLPSSTPKTSILYGTNSLPESEPSGKPRLVNVSAPLNGVILVQAYSDGSPGASCQLLGVCEQQLLQASRAITRGYHPISAQPCSDCPRLLALPICGRSLSGSYVARPLVERTVRMLKISSWPASARLSCVAPLKGSR